MKTFKHFLYENHYGSLVDTEKYNHVDQADKALYLYTADGYTALDHVIDDLIERYPYDGGTLYRGLHFDSQEQYDKLVSDLKAGSMTYSSPSSWTPHKSTAQGFARSKKSYFPSLELMKASSDMQDRGDHMTGYGGIVLTTKVGKNVGCDVTKSEFSKENEVILKAGDYDVKIEELVAPFHRQYDTPDKVHEIMTMLSKSKKRTLELDKLAEYVRRSWQAKLPAEDLDVLVKYNAGTFFALTAEELSREAVNFEIQKTFHNGGKLNLNMYISIPIDYKTYEKCTDKMQALIDKKIKIIVKALTVAVKQIADHDKIDEIHEFNINNIKFLRDYLPAEVDTAIKPLRKILGDKYHQLNTREYGMTLKSRQDIADHAKRLSNVISAMTQL